MDPWGADLDPLGVRAYPSPLTEAEVKSLCHPVKLVPAYMVLHVSLWLTHSCVFVLQVSILETNSIFLKIFLNLKLASSFSYCLFLISYSIKHLKIYEGSTAQGCPCFGPDLLAWGIWNELRTTLCAS